MLTRLFWLFFTQKSEISSAGVWPSTRLVDRHSMTCSFIPGWPQPHWLSSYSLEHRFEHWTFLGNVWRWSGESRRIFRWRTTGLWPLVNRKFASRWFGIHITSKMSSRSGLFEEPRKNFEAHRTRMGARSLSLSLSDHLVPIHHLEFDLSDHCRVLRDPFSLLNLTYSETWSINFSWKAKQSRSKFSELLQKTVAMAFSAGLTCC